MDVAIVVGFTIPQRAKLKMLEHHYDCLGSESSVVVVVSLLRPRDVFYPLLSFFARRFVRRSDYQCINMNTDSCYKALAGHRHDDIINPVHRRDYLSLMADGLWSATAGSTGRTFRNARSMATVPGSRLANAAIKFYVATAARPENSKRSSAAPSCMLSMPRCTSTAKTMSTRT